MKMCSCIALLLLPLAVRSLTFDRYLKQYGKAYEAREYDARQALFQQRLADIETLNARPNALWKAGLNQLSDLDESELRQHRGYNKAFRQTGADSQGFGAGFLQAAVRMQLPESHDWRDRRPAVVSPVKSQGSCGSCWAFAAAQAIESHVALATGKLLSLSPQQLTSCTPNPQKCGGAGGCAGAVAQLAFNYTVQAGGLSEIWDYPYVSGMSGKSAECHSRIGATAATITGYSQLARNDAAALIEAVFSKGPVAVSVDASRWHMYESGIYDHCNRTNPDLNHAVNIVGYGRDAGIKYWQVRNSWGTLWGEDGYMRLLRHYDSSTGGAEGADEPCGEDLNPSNGFGCEGGEQTMHVCGECGILSDSAFPTGGSFGYAFDVLI